MSASHGGADQQGREGDTTQSWVRHACFIYSQSLGLLAVAPSSSYCTCIEDFVIQNACVCCVLQQY